MLGAVTRDSTRCDLSPFGCEIPEGLVVLIVNYKVTICTKLTYFSSMIGPFEFFLIISVTAFRSIVCHFYPLDPLLPHCLDHG